MIQGLTDTKKHFFIWNIVTIAIFSALFFGLPLLLGAASSDNYSLAPSDTLQIFGITFSEGELYLLYALLCYAVATFPMGFFVRRKIMKKYFHIPTEDIKIFESNILLAFFRVVKCQVLLAINLILLAFYLTASAVIGIVIFPYQLISGVILMISGKMA